MARVELNIVALGDFTSVNTQITQLKAQVDLLNKSLVGVGISPNLSAQLKEANAAFKATMLSTGQFTASTVALKSETDKFGASLSTGKLKLAEYFKIIKAGTTNATLEMRALALEQTKLQNSIVMADPSKQGLMSVYTPTRINAITNATKIATNMQNIYNIAVDKGTQSLINWGKNTQWAGRQLTVGMTVPLMLFGSSAIKTFQDVNAELVRLQKVYGTGLTQPTKQVLDSIKAQVTGLAKELASSMGVAAKDTAAMAADLAAVGLQGNDLLGATREAMRLSKLGEMDAQSAMKATISLQNVYKLNTQQLSGAVNFLNAVENQTSTSLQDLVDGIPRVGPIVQQLGGSFKDTAIMMVAMKEAGVPAAQSANAIKSAIASLINPTTAAKKAFAEYNINLSSIATSTKGNPVQMIMMLRKSLEGLAPLAKAQLIEKLFGKFQEARISALISNLGALNSQTKTAFDLANASDSQLAGIASAEMKTATESTTGKFKRAVETLKADLLPVGEKIMQIATTLLNFGNSVSKVFTGLPGPVKTVMGIIAAGVALSGPIIMFTGVLANFVGYLMKGLFALVSLKNGTKTFGELFTPEIIASQNAAQLFSNKILEDESAVSLLNKAVRELTISLEGMSAAMTASSTTSFAQTVLATEAGLAGGRIPFKGAKMASGGYVPGNPSHGDVYPAMLTGGEAVIPSGPAKKYAPFINGMINGRLPGYMSGKEVFSTIRDQYGGNLPYTSSSGKLKSFSDKEFAHLNSPKTLSDFSLQEQALLRERSGVPSSKLSENISVKDATGAMYHREINQLTNDGKLEANKLISYLKGLATEFTRGGKSRTLTHDPEIAYGHLMDDLGIVDKKAREKYALELDKRIISRLEREVGSGKSLISDSGKNSTINSSVLGEEFGALGNESGYGSGVQSLSQPMELRARGASSRSGANRYFLRGGESRVSGVLAGLLKGTKRSTPTSLGAENILSGNFVAGQAAVLGKEINSASKSSEIINSTKKASKNIVEQVAVGIKEGETEITSGAGSSGGILSKLTNPKGKLGMGARMGGSMALMMGGQMLGGMLPKGSIASSMFGSASQMAGMGMMFGPWGAAAGAALGIATSGISALIKVEKDHKIAVESSFKASSDAVTMFGGTLTDQTIHVHSFFQTFKDSQKTLTDLQKNVDAISKLDAKSGFKILADSLKGMSTANSVIGTVKQFAAAQVANGMDPSKVSNMVSAMLTYAGKTEYLDQALKNISLSTKNVTTATTTWINKLQESSSSLQPLQQSYSDLTSSQKRLSDGLLSVYNQILNTNTSFVTAENLASGLQDSIKNTADAYAMLEFAAKNAGDAQLESFLKQSYAQGLSPAQASLVAKVEQSYPAPSMLNLKGRKEWDIQHGKQMIIDHNNLLKQKEALANTQVIQEKAVATNKELLKIAEKKLAAEQATSNAIKTQNDFMLSQTDLQNQMRVARAKGDFLQAGLLQQQIYSKQKDYVDSTTVSPLQAEVNRLKDLVDNGSTKLAGTNKSMSVIDKALVSGIEKSLNDGALKNAIDNLTLAINKLYPKETTSTSEGLQFGNPIKSATGQTAFKAAQDALGGKTQSRFFQPPGTSDSYTLFNWSGKTYAVDPMVPTNIYNFDNKTNTLGKRLSSKDINLPKYNVGTSYVPHDMIAQIHKGERIIPASQNNGTMDGSRFGFEIINKAISKFSNKAISNLNEMFGLSPTNRILHGKTDTNWDYLGMASMLSLPAKSLGVMGKLLESADISQFILEKKAAGFNLGGQVKLPSFDVGTNFVPNDMIAQIHKGERIIPASQNNGTMGTTINMTLNIARADSSIDIENAVKSAMNQSMQKMKMTNTNWNTRV